MREEPPEPDEAEAIQTPDEIVGEEELFKHLLPRTISMNKDGLVYFPQEIRKHLGVEKKAAKFKVYLLGGNRIALEVVEE